MGSVPNTGMYAMLLAVEMRIVYMTAVSTHFSCFRSLSGIFFCAKVAGNCLACASPTAAQSDGPVATAQLHCRHRTYSQTLPGRVD